MILTNINILYLMFHVLFDRILENSLHNGGFGEVSVGLHGFSI